MQHAARTICASERLGRVSHYCYRNTLTSQPTGELIGQQIPSEPSLGHVAEASHYIISLENRLHHLSVDM